jgi:hypothetical protein
MTVDSKEKPKDLSTSEVLQADNFVNNLLIGPCPKCGSGNVHDCEAQSPTMEKSVMFAMYRQYGSNCPVAKKLNDPGVGHCDDCGFLWCLGCGSKLTEDEPNCGHWLLCDPENCDENKELIDYEDNVIEGAYSCPYDGSWQDCPKIIAWKRKKKEGE